MRLLFTALALLFPLLARAEAADDLYRRLGEKARLARIADKTIDYSLADERIKATFAEANIPRLKGLLALQFCAAAGGPCTYPGRSMAEAHAELGLRDVHFNALVEDLQRAMDDEGIGFATQNEFLARLAPMHSDVVKR
jgi:hemoglobin